MPQHIVGIQVNCLVRGAILLEADEIVQVDVVQVEFEVVIVIIQVVQENWNPDEGSIHAAVDCVCQCESLWVYPAARLKKAQLLIGPECKSSADRAIRHSYVPVVSQQVIQYPRQILLDETSHIRFIDHVVSDA